MTPFKIVMPPPGHPLHDYAAHMMHTTNSIYNMLIMIMVLLVVLIVVFGVFAYQKLMERKENRAEREANHKRMEELSTKVVDMTVACGAILSSIKGRSLIFEQVEATRADKVEKATAEMKSAVIQLPEKTADKTAEKVMKVLDERASLDGSMVPTVPPSGSNKIPTPPNSETPQ